MRVLLVGDIHLADRPPASCTDTYLDDLFDLLEQTVQVETDYGCDLTVWAGDVFHYKHPSRTSHATMLRLIELCGKYRHLRIVPGNHDLQQDRLGSIFESQPLGVLVASGTAKLLWGWAPGSDGDWLFGLPWQQDWSDLPHALAQYRGQSGLVVTHAPLFPPGLELPFEHVSASQWAAAMGNQGAVYYGHIHEAHGTYTVDGVTFCNQGALSRGSLHEVDLTRQIAVTVAEVSPTGGVTFERVPLEAKPADAVFRLVEIGEQRAHQSRVSEFVDSLGTTVVSVADSAAITHAIQARSDVPKPVRDKAVELVLEQ